MERIVSAGNVEVPAVLALRSRGFLVRCDQSGDRETWFAEADGISLIADAPLELLGLAALREDRGVRWKASDDEIDAFLEEYNQG